PPAPRRRGGRGRTGTGACGTRRTRSVDVAGPRVSPEVPASGAGQPSWSPSRRRSWGLLGGGRWEGLGVELLAVRFSPQSNRAPLQAGDIAAGITPPIAKLLKLADQVFNLDKPTETTLHRSAVVARANVIGHRSSPPSGSPRPGRQPGAEL